MSRSINWRNYVNEDGDFELPNYLYRVNNDLMKETLDLGTLLSEDQRKLRAFKEQIKKIFKQRWMQIAEALDFFDLVVPCICSTTEYCEICGGSRYNINQAIAPDRLREIGVVFGMEEDMELADQLHKGLMKALREAEELEKRSWRKED